MKIDKHFDPTDDLERELLKELDDIAKQLRGKITYSHYGNSDGKSSKTGTIVTPGLDQAVNDQRCLFQV